MRHVILTLSMIIAVGLFAVAEGRDLRTDVAGTEGSLGHISTVELAPGAVDVRYFHLGGEVIYVLDGAGTLRTDGTRPVALKVGTVVQLLAKHHHVLTNTSLTQTLKVLVVNVETGQTHLVLANRGTRKEKEARQQNEGCQLIPNEGIGQHKTDEDNSSTMKGLVF
jgi:quercetin dioxygenase-like cupin family protein